ncbi:MAG TPA: DUF2550 domain-containing protein [Mycobacteriales bacterium]|nr:DUF2550 domain-containing protein [Mycobacteriales bacterium]
MAALDALGIALLTVCLLLLALVARRRLLSRAGGTVEMSLRGARGHWAFGVARFERDRLLWFRTFSLSPRPRRELARTSLHVEQRRSPHGHEIVTLVPDAVVLECRDGVDQFELALPASASLGFLAWLEAGHRPNPYLQTPPRAS